MNNIRYIARLLNKQINWLIIALRIKLCFYLNYREKRTHRDVKSFSQDLTPLDAFAFKQFE